MDVLTLLVAVAGLLVAGVALALVLRDRGASGADHVTSTRSSGQERQLAQALNRLDFGEGEVDGQEFGRESDPGSALSRRLGPTVSHIGLVRFDAFEDAGGAQSFALALLDDDGDGIVLTSLHSRPTTRLYIKAIRGGAADAPLSEEETRALQEAGLTS